MPVTIYTPRINNNDDVVRLTCLHVEPGTLVRQGDPIAEVETDKATFTVEAEQEGYLLGFGFPVGETIAVGSVLAWLGASADEPIPSGAANSEAATAGVAATPTLKAAILLAQYGLSAQDVPASGERLSATDVEQYIASRGLTAKSSNPSGSLPVAQQVVRPSEPGKQVRLTPPKHGMLRTVAWHKGEAVPAYLEISCDPAPWTDYAAAFQQQHRLLFSPLLALMARRLVSAALDHGPVNATVAGEQLHLYDHVNLGFTVQSGDDLIVVVIREAETLDELAFAKKLSDLQRRAMRNALHPDETAGATIGFSSMARWPVRRHVPVLLPHTALMIAHTAPSEGSLCLGATYDHRILNGGEVVRTLQALAIPSPAGLS